MSTVKAAFGRRVPRVNLDNGTPRQRSVVCCTPGASQGGDERCGCTGPAYLIKTSGTNVCYESLRKKRCRRMMEMSERMCLNAPLKPTQHFDAGKRECI